jgi:hypothetical protein
MNIHYMAGIFDGEGYVYIFKKQIASKPHHIGYYVSSGVTMTHLPTVEAFHNRFGGHLNSGSRPTNPKHRPTFSWGIANKKAVGFLKAIRPYVLVKADEIDVALALQEHIEQAQYVSPGRTHMTERPDRAEILAYREELFQRCKALKTRSFEPLLRKGPGPNGKSRGRPRLQPLDR